MLLDYFIPIPTKAPVTELDHALAVERGRWIRRRLFFYAGSALALMLIGVAFTLSSANTMRPAYALIDSSISVILLVTAIIVACRTAPNYPRILRIAVGLFIGVTTLNLISARLTLLTTQARFSRNTVEAFNQSVAQVQRDDARREAAHAKSEVVPPVTVSVTPTPRPGPTISRATADRVAFAMVWAVMAFTLLYNHLLASFFIPWAWRDTLRPVAMLLGFYLVGLVIDAELESMPSWLWLPLGTLGPLAFLPGSIVCWWRYSRFNKTFRLQFESRGYRALQTELDGARRIHDACLPAQLRSGPVRINYTYQPMRQIGGDLLFVHPAPAEASTTRLVVLLDVMGHGIAAALTVNRIVGELERIVSETPAVGPKDLLTTLNRYAHFTLSRHSVFLTALAARVDGQTTGRVAYANAGHPLPVLCRADNSTETFDSTAMLLGAAGPADFDCGELEFTLSAGDRFIAYTDGASDTKNAAGLPLGTAGVTEIIRGVHNNRVPGHHAPRIILDLACRHRIGLPEDDVLVVELALG